MTYFARSCLHVKFNYHKSTNVCEYVLVQMFSLLTGSGSCMTVSREAVEMLYY